MATRSLRQRLSGLVTMWLVVVTIVGATLSVVSLRQYRHQILDDSRMVAVTLARSLDALLLVASEDLGRLPGELEHLDARAAPRLRAARFHSLFGSAIHLVTEDGEVLATDPSDAPPPPSRWLEAGHGISPLLFRDVPDGSDSALVMLVPFERRGRRYFVVAEMAPGSSRLGALIRDISAERRIDVALLDGSGTVIAASDEEALLRRTGPGSELEQPIGDRGTSFTETSECLVCPSPSREGIYLTAVTSLDHAPWAVVIQEPKGRAFAPLTTAQIGIAAAIGLLVLLGLPFNRALSTTVVAPLTELARRADRIRAGDLETPVDVEGDREIQALADALDDARRQLAANLDELRVLNEGLEELVAERTEALERRVADLELLSGILVAAAEEHRIEVFGPHALDLIHSALPLDGVALVASPPSGPARIFAAPDPKALPWLESGSEPPEGWRIRWLTHQDDRVGRLYYRWTEEPDEEVMNGIQRELAAVLYGAYLFEHVVEQDARRRALVERLLSAGEEERRRIARELHDEIAQLLTAVRLSLDEMPPSPALDRAFEILSRTQQEVHRIIHDLRPSLLDDLGLPAAVRSWATTRLEEAGIDVYVETDDDLELPGEIEITVFRIFQEIVTNVLRHAEAQHVSIELFRDATGLRLLVEDDGVGFAPEETTKTTGILGMRERASLVNGQISFESEPGTGTVVSLRVPLSETTT